MADVAFSYPSILWIVAAGAAGALIGAFVLKNIMPTLFLGLAGLGGGFFLHQEMLPDHVEKWLASQRVYAILFRDFPKDKEHFISEYVTAYKNGGEVGVSQKQQEMKVIMLLHHVPHYIERAHADTLEHYIMANAWLMSELYKKDHTLCNAYMKDTQYFANVWNAVGTDIYLASLKDVPTIIVEGSDSPQDVPQSDLPRAIQLTGPLLEGFVPASSSFGVGNIDLCNAQYREFYLLSRMAPKDGALTLKYILGENHLKQSFANSFLQKIMPW